MKIFRRLSGNSGTIALAAMLCMSLAVNIFLGVKLKSGPPLYHAGVQVSADLRVVPIVDEAGQARDLALNRGHRTALYIMAPTCGWCRRNLDNIRTLATRQSGEMEFIGISSAPANLKAYLATTALSFPVYAVNLHKVPPQLDVTLTPQLVVVGPTGIVERAWWGAFNNKTKVEIESYFHITLPGLT